MFVIVMKDLGNLYCYSSFGISGPVFEKIHNFKDRSGISSFIFYSEIEANNRKKYFPNYLLNSRNIEIEIVPLTELQAKIQEFFS